jgi:hypothetical protein
MMDTGRIRFVRDRDWTSGAQQCRRVTVSGRVCPKRNNSLLRVSSNRLLREHAPIRIGICPFLPQLPEEDCLKYEFDVRLKLESEICHANGASDIHGRAGD